MILKNQPPFLPQTIGDLTFYTVGGLDENEVVLSMVLTAFYESVSLLLRYVEPERKGKEENKKCVRQKEHSFTDSPTHSFLFQRRRRQENRAGKLGPRPAGH